MLRPELAEEIAQKAIRAGLYAANMPEEVGGAGLDTVTWVLYEKELGRANYALHSCVGRPSNILLGRHRGAEGALPLPQRPRRAARLPRDDRARRGLRPARHAHQGGASTRRSDGWRIKGTKHFISHADESDFVILFAVTDDPADGQKAMSTFLVDLDTPGLAVHDGYRNVSHRGYTNSILDFDDCWVPGDALLGEEGKGFDLAGTWLGSTRLQVAATCLGPGGAGARPRRTPRRRPRAVRPEDRPLPGHLLQARRHGGGAAGGGAADAGGGVEVRRGRRPPTPTSRWPSSRRPRCWRWSPTRRSRSTAAWA